MTKRIVHFSMKQHGFFLDFEDAECAVSVTPNEGDVLLHEGSGEGRLNGVCIPGSQVIEFEAGRVEGSFGIRVWYKTQSDQRFHDLGTTEKPTQAEAWVGAVNAIYATQGQKSEKAAEGEFRLGKFRSNPVIHDIIEKQTNIILPGTYLYSRDEHPPRFPQAWNEFRTLFPFDAAYVQQSITRLQDFARTNERIENHIYSPPAHDYSWLSQTVRYRRGNFANRITQPLEMIFDREERREDVGVIPAGKVRHFAIVYWRGKRPAERLSLKPDEVAASSFNEWISRIAETENDEHRVIVLTPSHQAVDYALQDAIAQRRLSEYQRNSAPAHLLAEYLWVGANQSVVACDMGVAYQLLHSLQTQYKLGAEQLAFSLVPYERPITVGFCYRSDDPEWGSICNVALNDTLHSTDSQVQEHLERLKCHARAIGIEWAFAA